MRDIRVWGPIRVGLNLRIFLSPVNVHQGGSIAGETILKKLRICPQNIIFLLPATWCLKKDGRDERYLGPCSLDSFLPG